MRNLYSERTLKKNQRILSNLEEFLIMLDEKKNKNETHP